MEIESQPLSQLSRGKAVPSTFSERVMNMPDDDDVRDEKKSSNLFAKIMIVGIIVSLVFFVALSTIPTDFPEKRLELVRKGRGAYKYSTLGDDDIKALFEDFMVTYNRQYSDDNELQTRYQNFVDFLALVDDRNAAEEANGGTGVHGVTKFADRSNDEITILLNAMSSSSSDNNFNVKKASVFVSDEDDDDYTVNWAGTYTTSIKDQGYCGGCWAFSGISQIESDSIIAGYLNTSDPLSTQQVVSCDEDDEVEGCSGGWLYATFDYAEQTGIVSASSYPYTSYWGDTGTCLDTLSSLTKLVTVTDYYQLSTEEEMKAYVKSTGPLAVCVDASNWISYESGILSVCGTDIDHCVQVVGISVNSDSTSYWIIRNSWGTDWGLDGYLYLEYGEDLCEISHEPTYSSVESA